MITSICFQNGESMLPVYYEYTGMDFAGDFNRACILAERAGEKGLISLIPEKYLSVYGITYVRAAETLSIENRKITRDPWEGSGMTPCSCKSCAHCVCGKGGFLYCTKNLEAAVHACGEYTANEEALFYFLRFEGEPVFAFQADNGLSVSPIRIARMFAGVSLELQRILDTPDAPAWEWDVVDGADGAPAPFLIHGVPYFFPAGKALMDLGFYPDHPELSALGAEAFFDASSVYAKYHRIAVCMNADGLGELVVDPKILSEMEWGGYLIRE